MKTRTKLAFIDQQEDKLTAIPIKPIKAKVKEFRKEELAKIKEEDQLYLHLFTNKKKDYLEALNSLSK